MGASLSIILDVLIILLLTGTIFYAVRLSTHIKAFRDNRKELGNLIGDLSSSIESAENAIGGLRENTKASGRDLQALINDAQALSEELQIMTQSGNSLAGRLEKLTDKTADISRAASSGFDLPPRGKKKPLVKPVKKKEVDVFSGFAIRDSEFESGMDEGGLMEDDYEEETSSGGLSSQAERDLYEALRKKKKVTI